MTMLTDADRSLVAAANDGPLTPKEAERLGRLLATSADARRLADELVSDRQRLGGLPHYAAPAGFTDDVLGRLPIIVPSRPVERPRRSAWLPVATAAGVLTAVGVLTFQLTGPQRQPPAQQGIAKTTPPGRPTSPPASRVDVAPSPRPAPEAGPQVASVPAPAPRTPVAPRPRPADGPELFAAGLFTGIEPPAEATARLPLLSPLPDFETPSGRAHVKAVWATLPAVRLDLFVADPAAAVPAVQEAAKSCGWVVTVDQTAQALLKSKQPGTFAVYVDGLAPADGAAFLAVLAAQKGGGKIGPAHLSAFGPADSKEVRDLLGEPKRSARELKDGSTIGQVVKQLAPRHPALLFAQSPPGARPGPASKEVRGFTDGRGERSPGAVPLLLVIRAHEAN